MHYREGDTRRCTHGPSDSNPAHKSLGDAKYESASILRALTRYLEGCNLTGIPMLSTAVAARRAEQDASAIRWAWCHAPTDIASELGVNTDWRVLLIGGSTSLAKCPVITPTDIQRQVLEHARACSLTRAGLHGSSGTKESAQGVVGVQLLTGTSVQRQDKRQIRLSGSTRKRAM